MEYADLDQLIADYLPESRSEAEKAALERILTSTTRAIDSWCDRPPQYFAPAGEEAVERFFYGQDRSYLPLPVHAEPITELAAVEWGQDLSEDYWTERSGWLYRIVPLYANGFPGVWLSDVEYSITARWGYSETPADVVEACRLWVVHIFERQRGTIGQVTPAGFVIDRDMPPIVETLLTPYRRKEYEVQ